MNPLQPVFICLPGFQRRRQSRRARSSCSPSIHLDQVSFLSLTDGGSVTVSPPYLWFHHQARLVRMAQWSNSTSPRYFSVNECQWVNTTWVHNPPRMHKQAQSSFFAFSSHSFHLPLIYSLWNIQLHKLTFNWCKSKRTDSAHHWTHGRDASNTEPVAFAGDEKTVFLPLMPPNHSVIGASNKDAAVRGDDFCL